MKIQMLILEILKNEYSQKFDYFEKMNIKVDISKKFFFRHRRNFFDYCSSK